MRVSERAQIIQREWKDTDQIRAGLARAAEGRVKADKQHAQATAELKRWLREAKRADRLSMVEAARLGGVTRSAAYEMLKE